MIWDWIIGAVPPWAWLIGGVLFAAVIVAVLRQGGWKWAVGVLVAFGAVFLQSRSYQRGATSERVKQEKADTKARDVIAERKENVRTAPQKDKDERFDRWQNPS